MRPVIVLCLAVLLASFASATFFAEFRAVDEPFYQGSAGRVQLNASCAGGYSTEYLEGDLVRFRVQANYPPNNTVTVLKNGFFVNVEPCAEIANQIFLLQFPSNSTSVNISFQLSRADYPKNYYPIFFQQSFAVLAPPVASNESNGVLTGDVLLEGSNAASFKFPKPDWLVYAVVVLALLGVVLLFFVHSLKWGVAALLLAIAAFAYYAFA